MVWNLDHQREISMFFLKSVNVLWWIFGHENKKRHNYLPNIIICICNNFSWNCFENNNSEIQRVFSLHQSEICWAWTNGLRVRVNILLTLHWFKNRTNLKSAWRKKIISLVFFCFVSSMIKDCKIFFEREAGKYIFGKVLELYWYSPTTTRCCLYDCIFFPIRLCDYK